MRICFIIGSADISGGTLVIFQHALHLREHGHLVTIVPILEPLDPRHLNWHPATRILDFKSFAELDDVVFDLVVSTWWQTAYQLSRVRGHQYVYFVQSIETWFVPPQEVALRDLIHATYLLPLPIITEANWIREYLEDNFGHSAFVVPNGVNKDIFQSRGRSISRCTDGRLRILAEGSLEAGMKNVPRTIELMRRSNADEIWLLTPSRVSSYPGVDRVFSRVPLAQTAEIYRSCDAIVKLSYVEGMFGPPLEMFCCGGTAIVYDVTGHDEYIRHDENAIVVKTDDERQVVAAINRIKDNSEELARLKSGAIRTAAQWPDWPEASSSFAKVVEQIVSLPAVDKQTLNCQIEEHTSHYRRTQVGSQPYGWMKRARAGAIRLIAKLPFGERVQIMWLAHVKARLRPRGGRRR